MFVAATTSGARPTAAAKTLERSSLSMYADPPNENITLEDFEILAFERLKLLKVIENAKSRGLPPDQFNDAVKEALKSTLGKPTDPTFYRNDQVSHHILRLAYCSTEEQRRWFLTQECLLFRHRAERETPERILEFMSRYNLDFELASAEEKAELKQQLRQTWEWKPPKIEALPTGADSAGAGGGANKPEMVDATFNERDDFYKVAFMDVNDLVSRREVFVKGGMAYVPRIKMVSSLVAKFRAYNSYSLVAANKFLPAALRDERLKPMLENMSKTYVGPEYNGSKKSVDVVTANDVDELATSIFPLCMTLMHQGLKDRHKLKHLGRLQYGLFLKGVGLPMEEALVFWQREFTKGCSGDEFLKKYAYNIRYNYGKEGKRTDFTPYSCVKVIMSPPVASDEVHGCPFKALDMSSLKGHLSRMKIPSAAVDSIAESVRAKEYQVACRKQFEARFPGADSGNVGNHPNAYAEAANNFLKGLAATAAGGAGGAGAGAAAAAGSGAAGPQSPAEASSPAGGAGGAAAMTA